MWATRSAESDQPAPPSIDDWAALMPVPLLGLVPQASVDEAAGGSIAGVADGVTHERTVRITYTLWRVPEHKDDPRNLAELDDDTRRVLDTPIPPGRPVWIREFVRRLRYPLLWDAVSTAWYSPDRRGERPTIVDELVQHANYVLVNRHPEPGDRDGQGLHRPEAWERVRETHVEHGIAVTVNGDEVDGIRIDTDPYVYAVGADLGDRMLTAVFDRDDLPYLHIAFADRG
jgi:hypothetical protein